MAHDSLYWNISNLAQASVLAGLTAGLLLLTAWLATRKKPLASRWGLRMAALGTLFLCPWTQWVALEPINMHQLERMGDKAREVGLTGKTKQEVQSLLGSPSWVGSYSPSSETWEYRPVPFYFFRTKMQVHFDADGVVRGWENYDD